MIADPSPGSVKNTTRAARTHHDDKTGEITRNRIVTALTHPWSQRNRQINALVSNYLSQTGILTNNKQSTKVQLRSTNAAKAMAQHSFFVKTNITETIRCFKNSLVPQDHQPVAVPIP